MFAVTPWEANRSCLLEMGTRTASTAACFDFCPPSTNSLSLTLSAENLLDSNGDDPRSRLTTTGAFLCHLNISRCHSGYRLLETILSLSLSSGKGCKKEKKKKRVWAEMLKTSFDVSLKCFNASAVGFSNDCAENYPENHTSLNLELTQLRQSLRRSLSPIVEQ